MLSFIIDTNPMRYRHAKYHDITMYRFFPSPFKQSVTKFFISPHFNYYKFSECKLIKWDIMG